jgi:transposase-like protein
MDKIMLEVETNHQIVLMYFKEGKSLREIAKELHINRKTVKARVELHKLFKASPEGSPGTLNERRLFNTNIYDTACGILMPG